MDASNTRLLLAPLVLALCLLGMSACTGDGEAPEDTAASSDTTGAALRPNIVLIVADDLGYGDLGSYGQQRIRTPHLDRMAREGLRFTQFYAGSTVCAPSRSVLMTGLHTGHTPIRGNKEVFPIGQAPLPAASETVAEVLQGADYRTGAFGKWGLGAPGTEGVPTNQGFDAFFGYLGQRRAHYYWPEFLFESSGDSLQRVPLEGNKVEGNPDEHPGSGPPLERGTYSHDAITERALSFIREHAGQEQPFFLYAPFTIPHASLTVPEEALAPYTDAQGNSIFDEAPSDGGHYTEQPMPMATYAAMVTRLDSSVGQILSTLEEAGAAKNTIVLFTSDNGPHEEGGYDPEYFDSNGPLRGVKRDLYEGGIRVPLIAWGPGARVPAGATSDYIGYFGDFLETFAGLAGTQAPKPNDSISMVPALTGRPAAQESHDYLYWEFHERGGRRAVRRGPWKAVQYDVGENPDGPIELYNLESDLGEQTNVADQHPDIVQEMERLMKTARTESPQFSFGQSAYGMEEE